GRRRIELFSPYIRRKVYNLPLQVSKIDHIEVDQADPADAGGCQVKSQRRPETASPDQQHLRLFELELTLHPHFGDDEVPAVAQDLVLGQGNLDILLDR